MTRITAAVLLLAISAIGRIARGHLSRFDNPAMTVWPSQVIFGFYFAILAVALQQLRTIFATPSRNSSRQALLLFIVVGLCLDLVLVNVQEATATARIDASYGFVVLWDAVTFFVWMRVVELCRPGADSTFRASSIVAIAPLFAMGREILFVPYATPADVSRAYCDLVFGNLLVCLWLFLSAARSTGRRTTKALRCLIFTGCAYWLINAVENVSFLAWSPLALSLKHAIEHAGVPVFLLSVFYALLAASLTFIVWRWNIFRLGTRFGIARVSNTGQSSLLTQRRPSS